MVHTILNTQHWRTRGHYSTGNTAIPWVGPASQSACKGLPKNAMLTLKRVCL